MPKKSELPFYTTLRVDDVITINEIPVRVVCVETRRGGGGRVTLAVDAPVSGEIVFDAASKSLTRLTTMAKSA